MNAPQTVQRLRAAEAVAREAGSLAMRYLSNPASLEVRLKGAQDVLTAADGAVERLIVATLRAAFAGDAFLGEEGGRVAGGAQDAACWVIDPIDGTANYARGLPTWCVSIAWVLAGRTELGVIYDPSANLMYCALRGGGAWRNGERLAVSTTTDVGRASVDTGYSSRTPAAAYGGLVSRLLLRGINVTQCGSAALGLARVADGRLDGYVERHLFAWDALAGLLLIEEAGGQVNSFLDGDGLGRGNQTIAATPALYAVLADALEGR
jgi:myo-inositol-1(or 4)-monophosphatase